MERKCHLYNSHKRECTVIKEKCDDVDPLLCNIAKIAYQRGVADTQRMAPNSFEVKTPIRGKDRFLCPTCREKLIVTNFCPNCGQKLKWDGVF